MSQTKFADLTMPDRPYYRYRWFCQGEFFYEIFVAKIPKDKRRLFLNRWHNDHHGIWSYFVGSGGFGIGLSDFGQKLELFKDDIRAMETPQFMSDQELVAEYGVEEPLSLVAKMASVQQLSPDWPNDKYGILDPFPNVFSLEKHNHSNVKVCSHEWVMYGFTSNSWCCKKCNIERP